MYLKEIELENFKSFEYAKIQFLKGFTAIAGPNGCGKSNISDAILFVLGPKSSKVLRAGKLTDLIFNGGKKKKGKNYCRATLVFDNKDRLIPIDCDEVSLTRVVRISRTDPEGYNSYFYVNNKKSTLTEFDNLLANAQLSADGYNLVQQGEITRIVHLTPLGRRKILDDIAGISKFDDEIAQATLKKTDVESNLERINIIINELTNRLKELQHDKDAASSYKNISEKLQYAKAQLAYKRKVSAEASVKSIQDEIKKLEEEQQKLADDIKVLDAKLVETNEGMKKIESEIYATGGAEFQNLKKDVDNLRLKIAREREGKSNSEEQINLLRKEIARAKEDLATVEKEIERLKKDSSKFEAEYNTKHNILRQKEEELKKLTELSAESDAAFGDAQRTILVIKKKIDDAQKTLGEKEIEFDRTKDKLCRLEEELGRLEDEKLNADKEVADTNWLIQNLKNEIKDCEKNLKSAQSHFYEKKNEEKKLIERIETLDNSAKQYRAEYEYLKAELKAADAVHRGYTNAVRAILEARDKNLISGIHGTVAELADVDEKYSTALQTAAGPRMQAIVVDNDEIAEKAIDYLKRTKQGRAMFLPLNKMTGGKPRGKALMAVNDKNSYGFAIDLIKFKPMYKDAFWNVFADTIVVKDLATARTLMGGVRLVTLEGELIEPTGAIIGGYTDKINIEFGTAKDVSEIADKLSSTEKELKACRENLKNIQDELTKIEQQIKDNRNKVEINNLKISELESKLKHQDEAAKDIESKLAALSAERDAASKKLLSLQDEIEKIQKNIDSLNAEKNDYEKKCVELVPEKIAKRINLLRNEILSLANESNTAKSSYDTFCSKIELKITLRNEIAVRIDNAEKQFAAHKQKIETYNKNIAEYENQLQAYNIRLQKADETTKELQSKLQDCYKSKTALEAEIAKSKNTIDIKEDIKIDRRSRLRSEFEKIQHLEAEIESYKMTIDTTALPSVEDLKTTIQDCETKLATFGAINMKALEEYEAVSKRHKELCEEVDRLKVEKENLTNLMESIEAKKKDGFQKVFTPINENFKRIYKELSMGGDAELVLEKPEDPLAGGLTVKAQPLHKKVSRLEHLSGGEQAVAAFALIFAIQQYLPSPFYLLDEPDMSLDAVNAERAAEIIKVQSKYAQFIVISLRKITLEKADHIIGVTFQPSKGVSEIVTKVDISKIESEAKAEEQRIASTELEAAAN